VCWVFSGAPKSEAFVYDHLERHCIEILVKSAGAANGRPNLKFDRLRRAWFRDAAAKEIRGRPV
jgi:hypothetical protein